MGEVEVLELGKRLVVTGQDLTVAQSFQNDSSGHLRQCLHPAFLLHIARRHRLQQLQIGGVLLPRPDLRLPSLPYHI